MRASPTDDQLARWNLHRIRLRWELQQLLEDKMKTWTDYGSGRLETTKFTLEAIQKQIEIVELVLADTP
jgi:hypothetical protein